VNVDDDLGGLITRTGLKSDANPTPTLPGMPVAPGRHRISKREEGCGVATDPAKAAGKDRRTLQRLVRKYSLDRASFKL